MIKQPELAYQYFVQAMHSGDADACYNAGMCLELGVGCDKNVLESLVYYHLGASMLIKFVVCI